MCSSDLEISWEHVEQPSDELNVGDEIEVKIISIDKEEEKVGLSIKALKEQPERIERKPRKQFRNNDKPRRKVERDNTKAFGDDDLNNNLGDMLAQALSEQGSDDLLGSIEEDAE